MASTIEPPQFPAGARLLEVGEHCLIGRALPQSTDFLCTSLTSLPPALPQELALIAPSSAAVLLRKRRYHLVVAHAPAFTPWGAGQLRFAMRDPLARSGPFLARAALLMRMLPAGVPLVLLDLEDPPIFYAHNIPLLDRALLCFKRELPESNWNWRRDKKNVKPPNLGLQSQGPNPT